MYSWRTEGPLGLFDKGKLTSQIFRDVPYAIVTLVSYEILQTAVVNAVRRQKIKQAAADAAAAAAAKKGSNNGPTGVLPATPSTAAALVVTKSDDPITAFVSAMFGNENNKKLRNALCGSLAGALLVIG